MDSNQSDERPAPENSDFKNNSVSKHIKNFFLLFVVLLALGSIIYMYTTYQASQSNKQGTAANEPPQPTDPWIPQESTTNTASSLDVPPTYPNATWKDESAPPPDSKLDIITAATKTTPFLEVPLTGYYLSTTLQDPNEDVEAYYATDLDKKGWSVNGSRLQFNTFSLQGLFANGPCGEIVGYLGYKDGFVKMITIQKQTTPCASPNTPTIANPSTNYTIFISESIAIQQIAEYIQSHSNK